MLYIIQLLHELNITEIVIHNYFFFVSKQVYKGTAQDFLKIAKGILNFILSSTKIPFFY